MYFVVSHLLKDELIFELHCRGASPDDSLTVKDLQGILRQLLELGKQGKSFKSEYNYIASEELSLITQKLSLVASSLNSDFTQNLLRKLETKLSHIFNRIEHIETTDSQELQEKAKLLSKALGLASLCAIKAENIRKSPNQPLDFAMHNAGTSTPVKQSANLSSTMDGSSNDLALKVLEQLSVNDFSRIKTWGLCFSGESDSLGLNAFLESGSELHFHA